MTTSSSSAASGSVPAIASGSVMLSMALSVGTRLKLWKMKPTRRRRSRVSSVSLSAPSSVSPMNTSPEVSESRPARQCSKVDLPNLTVP